MNARDLKEQYEALQKELNDSKIANQNTLQTEYAKQMEQVQSHMQNKMQEFQKAEQAKEKEVTIAGLRAEYADCQEKKEYAESQIKLYKKEMDIAQEQQVPESEFSSLYKNYLNYQQEYKNLDNQLKQIKAELDKAIGKDQHILFKDVKKQTLEFIKNSYDRLGKAVEKAKDIVHERNEQFREFIKNAKEKCGAALEEVSNQAHDGIDKAKNTIRNTKDKAVEKQKTATKYILHTKDKTIDLGKEAAEKIYHGVGNRVTLITLQYEKECLKEEQVLIQKLQKRKERIEEFSDRRSKATGLFKSAFKALQGKVNDEIDLDVQRSKLEEKSIDRLEQQIAYHKQMSKERDMRIKQTEYDLKQEMAKEAEKETPVQEATKGLPSGIPQQVEDRFSFSVDQKEAVEEKEDSFTSLNDEIDKVTHEDLEQDVETRDEQIKTGDER